MNEPIDSLSFEQALERLELVLRDLESTETGLDKSLERYEEGVRLLKRCRGVLDDAERKIRLLTGVDAEGRAVVADYSPESSDRPVDAPVEPGKPVRTASRGTRRGHADNDGGREQLF